jgi:chromosomal replication initiator protein
MVADIQTAVAKRYRIRPSRMKEPDALGSRKRRVARARQVAMSLSVQLTDHSLVRIGHFFGGRDHSTVIYACREVEKRRRKDRRIHNRMRAITLELLRK